MPIIYNIFQNVGGDKFGVRLVLKKSTKSDPFRFEFIQKIRNKNRFSKKLLKYVIKLFIFRLS